MAAYSVLFFGSHPDSDNDDCVMGEDFDTLADAERFYANPTGNEVFRQYLMTSTAFIMLDGPDVHRVKANPSYSPSRDRDEWQHEMAREAGMLHGVGASNDVYGY